MIWCSENFDFRILDGFLSTFKYARFSTYPWSGFRGYLHIDLARASDENLCRLLFAFTEKKVIIHDLKTFYVPLVKRLGLGILPFRYCDTYILAKMIHYSLSYKEPTNEELSIEYLWDKAFHSKKRQLPGVPKGDPQTQDAIRNLKKLAMLRDCLMTKAVSLWDSIHPFQFENGFVCELVRIETSGIPINKAALEEKAAILRPTIEELRIQLAAYGVNPDNGNALMEYAKEKKLKLLATTNEALEKHSGDLVLSKVLEYRRVKGPLDFLESILKQDSDRIFTHFEQISSRCGRMSSSNPNVQAIRRELKKKRLFYRNPPDRVLLTVDFPASHIRILAEVTGDEMLIKTFKEGVDPHRRTAACLLDKDINDVTDEERNLGKTINHGMTNCMGSNTLRKYANDNYGLEISAAQARRFLETFAKMHPRVDSWKSNLEDALASSEETTPEKCGAKVIPVKTRLGRVVKAIGLPEAVNYPLAGTEAEILKIAASKFGLECRERGIDAQIVNLVHDSMVVEAAVRDKNLAAAILKDVTERTFRMMVLPFHTPMIVEEL